MYDALSLELERRLCDAECVHTLYDNTEIKYITASGFIHISFCLFFSFLAIGHLGTEILVDFFLWLLSLV